MRHTTSIINVTGCALINQHACARGNLKVIGRVIVIAINKEITIILLGIMASKQFICITIQLSSEE